MRSIIIKILFVVCLQAYIPIIFGCSKADEKDESIDAGIDIEKLFENSQNRLANEFLLNGWVVSRMNGEPWHQGDSLIWTGLWIGAASCEAGNESEAAMQKTINDMGGALVRFPGINEATLDGALGLYRGIIERVKRCPDSKQSWLNVISLHEKFVRENDGRFNKNSDSRIEFFDVILAELLVFLSENSSDNFSSGIDSLMDKSSLWAIGVVATQAAAYRLHLPLLAFETLEKSGKEIPSKKRDSYCSITKSADMPTLDHWCGRGDLAGWIKNFSFDVWEYRHQRSGKWESADGKPGLRTPGLDLLTAIRARYKLKDDL